MLTLKHILSVSRMMLNDTKEPMPVNLAPARRSVLQDWVMELPFMQQSVLIAAMRGPDGVEKLHKSKMLCRWLRRCIVISAFDRIPLDNPSYPGGGSYTGPSFQYGMGVSDETVPWEGPMDAVVKDYLSSIDNLPHHFHLHFMHAAEILGYKHSNSRIRAWWRKTYERFAHDMHLAIETEMELDFRLNDNEQQWRKDESRFKS